MNRESFNSNTSQNPKEVIKNLDDLRDFDEEQLAALKADDPEAFYGLMEKIAEVELEVQAERYRENSSVEKPVKTVKKKENTKVDTDEHKRANPTYSDWLREH